VFLVGVVWFAAGCSSSTRPDYADPAAFSAGYTVAMTFCAALLAVGGTVAWVTIRSDTLKA
jgi:hypothetical protein